MKTEELDDFQKHITHLMQEWENTLKDLLKGNETVLKLSDEQAVKLEKEKISLETKLDSPQHIAAAVQKINLEITQLLKKLNDLDINNKAVLQVSDIQEVFYCIQLIQVRAEQLVALTDLAKKMVPTEKETEKFKALEETLFDMTEVLLDGKRNPKALELVFFLRNAQSIVQALLTKPVVTTGNTATDNPDRHVASEQQQMGALRSPAKIFIATESVTITPNPTVVTQKVKPTKPASPTRSAPARPMLKKERETLPKWLEEILAISNSVNGFRQLRTLYQQTKPFPDDSTDNSVARLMQPSAFISKKRAEQLQLIVDTLALLEKGKYTPDEKTRIARGLMLVIKHQIDHEHNVFKSRLGTMVNAYLNRTDSSNGKNRHFSEHECLVDFYNFSNSNLANKNSRKMKRKISTALHDTVWKEKQFYPLHQMVDSIKMNIATIDKSTLLEHKDKNRGEESILKLFKIKRDFIGWNNKVKKLSLKKIITMPQEMLSPITEARGALERLLKEFEENKQAGKDNTDTKADLYLISQRIEILLTACDYAIKIAEEKIPKLSELDSKQIKKDLNALEMPLKDLQNLCAHAIKELPSKTLLADIKPAKATTNNKGLFSLFKSDSTHKKEAFKKASELYDKIKAISPAISEYPQLNEFEMAYNTMMQAEPDKNKQHTPLLSTEGALNTAKELYKNMNTSSTKNLSATMLHNQITGLTRNIGMEIKNLIEHLPHSSDKIDQEDIYIKFRAIEKQLETLQYLSKIAAIKLDPSVNVVRRVNDGQAKKFQEAFSNPDLLKNIENFEVLRTNVLKKIGITPKNRSEP